LATAQDEIKSGPMPPRLLRHRNKNEIVETIAVLEQELAELRTQLEEHDYEVDSL
jgi:hypothetical protein